MSDLTADLLRYAVILLTTGLVGGFVIGMLTYPVLFRPQGRHHSSKKPVPPSQEVARHASGQYQTPSRR